MGRDIDPRVKKFAFIGLAIVILSLVYKYSFNLNNIMFTIKEKLSNFKVGQFSIGKSEKKKNKPIEKIELISVRAFEGIKKAISSKNLEVEGIFFDPSGKSFVTINGKVACEGEILDKIMIKKINSDSVEVIIEGESKIIEVK